MQNKKIFKRICFQNFSILNGENIPPLKLHLIPFLILFCIISWILKYPIIASSYLTIYFGEIYTLLMSFVDIYHHFIYFFPYVLPDLDVIDVYRMGSISRYAPICLLVKFSG